MAKTPSTIVEAEHKIEEFAADLGKILAHARSKAEGWIGQRQTIVKDLTALRDEATRLLSQLGHDAQTMVRRGRKPGRPTGSKNAAAGGGADGGNGKRTRRKMSAKARAAISAAQKKRWAKVKAAK